MADSGRERFCLDAGLLLLLLLHLVKFVKDLSRCIIHVQGDCGHSQIRLLLHSHLDKAIGQLASQCLLRVSWLLTTFVVLGSR